MLRCFQSSVCFQIRNPIFFFPCLAVSKVMEVFLYALSLATLASCTAIEVLTDNPLERRQQPGAVSADVFLRRAFHASTIVNKYLYIDGGQFSFTNNGTPSYQYGMLHRSRKYDFLKCRKCAIHTDEIQKVDNFCVTICRKRAISMILWRRACGVC